MTDWLENDLVQRNLITAEKMKEAQAEQEKSGEPLEKVLVQKGYVREEDLARILADRFKLPFIRFSKFLIAREVIEKVTPKIALHFKIVPVKATNQVLTIAMADPQNLQMMDEIRIALRSRYRIEPVVATQSDILSALKRYYGLAAETVEGMLEKEKEKAEQPSPTEQAGDKEIEIDDAEKMAGDASIVKLVNQVILEAWRKRATDIHIEPYRRKLQLRYRVDGILYPSEVPEHIRRFLPAIISRIKIMSNLNIVERRLPQDGRASIRIGKEKMDLRISILPTPYGESIVIRILPTSMLFDLKELGLSDSNRKVLEEMILRPYGIIFVTGPTGAGKSTTLYASLSRINQPERKIITIEDPIEYELEGITQIQVMPQIGLTFAQGLRSMLRHDPDVMMVGEVRDYETAELAVRIALTGHLVFSTLHTNDAASAVTRLLDMGVDPFLIVSSTECIIAQRLVRIICKKCKCEDKREVPPELLREIKEMMPDKSREIKFWVGAGCEECNHSGYHGRTGIHEFFVLSSKTQKLIMAKSSADDIKHAAMEDGMTTLRYDGWMKVLEGVTTVDEILRVTEVTADEENIA
ncbi:MAG: Flp pilus assembly complex ATPase component TadA [Candidatus Omnitrophica bacterium]|nr:Flp pilus assembly complex ATPase component TadA [Candidatus Omnitrophota bacterium]